MGVLPINNEAYNWVDDEDDVLYIMTDDFMQSQINMHRLSWTLAGLCALIRLLNVEQSVSSGAWSCFLFELTIPLNHKRIGQLVA